ncbi:MAG: hypothetical protein ABJM06_10920 [Gilvibacter sp.]
MRHINLVFVTVFTLFFLQSFAQGSGDSYNKIGISGGVVFSNIESDELNFTSGQGLTFGFETRGSFSKTVDFIYALSYFDAAMDIETGVIGGITPGAANTEMTTMKLSSVQLQFMGSLNIFRHHLSIEAGPAVAIQGKFKPQDDNDELRFVTGYNNVSINSLRETATVDFRGVVGLTAGFEPIRVSLMYVRGFTNTFSKLQQANTESADFSGNTSYLSLRGIVYF